MIKLMLDAASDSIRTQAYDHYIPLNIQIDNKQYKDGVDLDPQIFYTLLSTCKDFPKTSQPSPEDFVPAFEEAKTNGDDIIYLCLSSALSGTYQCANVAKQLVDYDNIYIIDTCAATHMIGMLAQYVNHMRSQGLSAPQIVDKVQQLRQRLVLYAGLDTLEYLYKGGRLSRTSAAVGSIANIKPIITVSPNGKVESFAKSIGIKRAISTIVKNVEADEIDTDFPVWSICTVDTENCDALEAALAQAGVSIAERMQVGSTIGAHVGPGVYGVIYVKK